MKRQSTTLLENLSAQHVAQLTTITKETLAPGFEVSATRKFTAAELWNIQRGKKTIAQRRGIM